MIGCREQIWRLSRENGWGLEKPRPCLALCLPLEAMDSQGLRVSGR